MSRLITCLLLLILAACEGPMGPEGPQGTQGPQGPQGIQGPAGESYSFFVGSSLIASNGRADVYLPVGAGSEHQLPAVTCYIGHDGVFLVVGTDLGGPICGMAWLGSRWRVRVLDGPPGWLFIVVAVW